MTWWGQGFIGKTLIFLNQIYDLGEGGRGFIRESSIFFLTKIKGGGHMNYIYIFL